VAETIPSSLAGKRIVITRSALQGEDLSNAIQERGAVPIGWPLIEFSPPEDFGRLDTAISQLGQFDWLIFTSGEAVRAVDRRCKNLGPSLGQACSNLRLAAVGPVTAEVVKKIGLQVDYVAQRHDGVALANELGERVRGRRVLLPRSDRANPDLPEALRGHGAEVTEVIAYRTLRPKEVDRERLHKFANAEADAILFFSPSAVQHFGEVFGVEQLHVLQDKLAITAVGPVTAKALREAGVRCIVVARDTTAASVIEALEEHFAGMVKQVPTGVKQR